MLGMKSLYRLDYQGENTIAHNINTLIEYANMMNYKLSFNELTLVRIIKFGYNNNWDTCFSHIKRIPDNLLLPPFSPKEPFKELITRSVMDLLWKTKTNNTSDFCIICSGGIDSSIIFYTLLELIRKEKLNVVHLIREGDENYYAILKQHFQCTLNDNINEFIIPTLYEEELNPTGDILYANESPIDLGSLTYNYRIFEWIRNNLPHVKYVFTGDGADELFAKYNRNKYYDSRLSDILDELVFYHIPRLEKTANHFGLEVLSPYLDDRIIYNSLLISHKDIAFGKPLKDEYKEFLPIEIIERKKFPLKRSLCDDFPEVVRNYRIKLVNDFKNYYKFNYPRAFRGVDLNG